METVTRDPWLDMTAVAHGYFHRQDFHLLDKQARLAALSLDGFRSGWMAATAALGPTAEAFELRVTRLKSRWDNMAAGYVPCINAI